MKRCSRSAAMNGCCFYPFYRGSSSLPLAVCAKGRASFSPLDCISHNPHFLVPKEVDFAKLFHYNEGDNRMFELARRYRVAALLQRPGRKVRRRLEMNGVQSPARPAL